MYDTSVRETQNCDHLTMIVKDFNLNWLHKGRKSGCNAVALNAALKTIYFTQHYLKAMPLN